MKLKRKSVTVENKEVRSIDDINFSIGLKQKQIETLQDELNKLYREKIELEIAPFKINEIVLVEVPMGKSRRKTECVLEVSGDTLYARPYKKDGQLSDRRFGLNPVSGLYSYQDMIKKIEGKVLSEYVEG